MKNKLIISLFCLFVSASIFAQIDRSQMPTPGPAPSINLGEPETFTLKNGLKVLVVENNKLPRVTARILTDLPPSFEEKPGTSALLSSLMGTGTENITKDEFNEEVDFLGANISYGSSSVYASSLSKFFPRVVELMADGLLNPVFTEEELEAERAKLIEGIKSNEKNTPAITSQVASALSYGKDHPYGQIETVESVESITLEDIQQMYNENLTPAKAYMVVVGDISIKEVKKLVKKHFKKWKGNATQDHNLVTPQDAEFAQINLVDMPNAVQSQVTVQNLVDLRLGDEDYFAVLVMNDILGGSFGSYLNMNLREDKGWTYGARSSVGTSRYPMASRFSASSQVRNAVTDSTVVEILKEIDKIRTEDVDAQKLEDVKKSFAGTFVLRLENPGTVANYALNIELNDLSEDFYENYLKKINAVSVEDVKRVANKYIKPEHLRFVIGGKGADIASGLENIDYQGKTLPVMYFDKEANQVEKPEFSKPIPDGVTLATVYADYIEAIGGEENAKAVESVVMKGNASIQGMSLNVLMKNTSDGKMLQSITMGAMAINKTVFDGAKGYTETQGQKMEFDEEQIEAQKKMAGIFPELNPSEGIELLSIQNLDGEDAYVVQISENVKEYYSVGTGLKLMTATTVEQGGQSFTTTIKYEDYNEIDGLKFPFKYVQDIGQELVINFDEILLNKEVSEEDFK